MAGEPNTKEELEQGWVGARMSWREDELERG
jgi:hypothetical protein